MNLTIEDIKTILPENGENVLHKILDDVNKFAKEDLKILSSSQLHRVFDELKRKEKPEQVQMMRPKLAYLMARTNGNTKNLFRFFDQLLKEVKSKNDVNNIVIFFEALVAYHKFHN